ncbi:GGDEF domain-containing protein [Pseudonocardia nematodicida]|uniref:GGDEF domain-containing protein n=1 Tax=Pseudonocardia nematodicida TaxID=1206997 RepID=A0ABV1KD12_9PSEU
MTSPPARFREVTRWPVWRTPHQLIGAIVVVEVLASALVVAGLWALPLPTGPTLFTMATLCVGGVLHTELVSGIERIRRYAMDTHHVNLTSVWTFAAALLLPPALAALVVAIVYGHLFVRVQRPVPPPERRPTYRALYNASTIVLAVHAAAGVVAATEPGGIYAGLPYPLTIVLALLAFTVVNTCLVLGAIAIVNPEARFMQILFGGDDLNLELATLCLGALVASALTAIGPVAALLVLPPILALHRTILVRQLREKADTDAKTGLLNHAAWHLRGSHALQVAERESRQAALLILDLDHFKEINDTHGHLYGDQVLASIARVLREELRDHDLVGRFGGEEFVVLLPRLSGHDGRDEVVHIAERLRRRVGGGSMATGPDGPTIPAARTEGTPTIGPRAVTVSIGGAVFPRDGGGITALLEVADSALYAAKKAGRDTVRIGPPPFPTAERA